MRLTDDKHAMLVGDAVPARHWAIEHPMRVGLCPGAVDSNHVPQAHIIADTGHQPTGPRVLDER